MDRRIFELQLLHAVRAALSKAPGASDAEVQTSLRTVSSHWALVSTTDVAQARASLDTLGHPPAVVAAEPSYMTRRPDPNRERNSKAFREALEEASRDAYVSRLAELDELRVRTAARWDAALEIGLATPPDPPHDIDEKLALLGPPNASIVLDPRDEPLLREILARPDWAVCHVNRPTDGISILGAHVSLTGVFPRLLEYTLVRRSPHRIVVSAPAERFMTRQIVPRGWQYWPLSLISAWQSGLGFADLTQLPIRPETDWVSVGTTKHVWAPGVMTRAFKTPYTAASGTIGPDSPLDSYTREWNLWMWRHPPPGDRRTSIRAQRENPTHEGVQRGPETGRCEFCGRPLYTRAAALVGHGPECARVHGVEPPQYDELHRRVTVVPANAWARLVRARTRA